jgi:Flp pilus assembly protein TadD
MAMSAFDPKRTSAPFQYAGLSRYDALCIGHAHYQAGNYYEAVKYTHNVVQQRPEHFGAHRQLCASLAQADRMEEARATADRLKQLQPNFSLAWVSENLPLTPEAMKHYLDGFRKAGLE